MSTHTTPPPHADQTGAEAAESARRASRFDERGIALQTVIIMVVLLAIAGTVAAVLLSRASDVTGELESQDITATKIDTDAECLNHRMGDIPGEVSGSGNTWMCTWEAGANADIHEVTKGRCTLVGGTFDSGTSKKDTCVVDVS